MMISEVLISGVQYFAPTPCLPTNIVGFRGFDSSIILIKRGGILRPIGDFPESLTQAILVGVMLVGVMLAGHSFCSAVCDGCAFFVGLCSDYVR